jgi:hypothetical protein
MRTSNLMPTSLKSAYINELLKYPVRLDRSLGFFKESYKGSYFSWLAYINPNHIELSHKIAFITYPTLCIAYSRCTSNPHVYSFYSLKDLESFKIQLNILYKQFKSAIIQSKLYTLNKDF